LLHGHDYEKGLKLDVLTGRIYDVGSRQLCRTLKAKRLKSIQDELRASEDFREIVAQLLD
jgi:hypothetical protein